MTDFRKTPDSTPTIGCVFLGDLLTESQATKLNAMLRMALGYEAKKQADGSFKIVRRERL